MDDSKALKQRLKQSGYSDSVLAAVWPTWWSEDAETSPSAQVELRFSIARKLGLDPRSLLDDRPPIFVWKDEAKFKHLTTESDSERSAMSSYGISIGRILVSAMPGVEMPLTGMQAKDLRRSIIANKPFVSLLDLLALCWGVGVPVIHLRVFPLAAKRVCAMSVRIGERFAILLGKDADYPPAIAFYLAHELGHIALGHIKDGAAVVDLADPLDSKKETDDEERVADQYALELLTGIASPKVDTQAQRFTAKQLGNNLLETGAKTGIEPGILALCFGYTTGDWAKTNGAMKSIYDNPKPVWREVNNVAASQLHWNTVPDDLAYFLRAVIGGSGNDNGSH